MSKNNSSRIGLGNIISLAGLALLGFLTFMGALMLTAGSMGAAIGIALGAVVVLSLLLAAAIHCKKVDNDFAKWKKMEIAALVVFFIVAAFPSRYVMHFIDVMSNKDELQKAAVADVESLRSMFNEYEKGEQKALATTTTGLHNAFGEECDANVLAYFEDAAIRSYDDIDSWILQERRLLLGNTGATGIAPYRTYKQNVDSLINQWVADVKVWDLMAIGRQAKVPSELAPAIADNLNERSQMAKLPIIVFEDGGYIIEDKNQIVDIATPKLKFEKKISTTSDLNVVSLVLYLVLVVLILVQYLMTPRSAKTIIGNGQNITHIEGVNRL